MLSQSAEYVLRVVVHLASQENPCTTHQLAKATGVPEGYLSKLLQSLGRNGIVHSQRGLHGGFVLAQPAGEISVLDVIKAVDPLKRTRKCPLGLAAHSDRLCPLHRRLDEAANLVEQAYADTTIAEIAADHHGPEEKPARSRAKRRAKAKP